MTCRDNGSTVRAYYIKKDGSTQQLESAYLCMESPIRSNHRLSEDFRDTAYLRHRRFLLVFRMMCPYDTTAVGSPSRGEKRKNEHYQKKVIYRS